MPKKHEGRQVLLVEDTRFYSIAVRDRLETQFGVKVTHCATFSALKRELANDAGTYVLAILDLCQPDAPDGEALDYVIARNIEAIVFSGISSDLKRDQILAKDVAEYVAKSSIHSIDDLAAAVDRRLSTTMAELLVIDPDMDQSILKSLLLEGRFSPAIVRNEQEALATLDKVRNIELVLIRSELAAKRGHAFLELLRNRYGEESIRVIGYSSAVGRDDVARFLNAGGDDFFHLPISAEDLAGRLHHTMTLHKQIQVLQHMASRDYLTDLLNRRYFFDRGPKIVDMCLRQRQPVSMALMDIDHFKKLNDTYGHEIGDVVLKAVAKKLMVLVGEKQHLVARLGGEEFGILFAGLDSQAAYQYCDQIRSEISEVRVVVDDEDISVTISMGLANISGSESFDNYLNAADQYLYLAKHSGRNRVFSDYQVTKIMAS
ncbi:MAG: diguanylate cyclase response regulator [Rhizobium sp.]|nr:diguanylate cyclase response regulator [Rhizobium sp.]